MSTTTTSDDGSIDSISELKRIADTPELLERLESLATGCHIWQRSTAVESKYPFISVMWGVENGHVYRLRPEPKLVKVNRTQQELMELLGQSEVWVRIKGSNICHHPHSVWVNGSLRLGSGHRGYDQEGLEVTTDNGITWADLQKLVPESEVE